MWLITFEFENASDDIGGMLRNIEGLKDYWAVHAVRFQIFRDTARKSRFLCTFFTDKSVDEIVGLIKKDPEAKSIFERLKKAGVHVVLSVMEEIK